MASVVVIGAGVAGLAVAARLADFGHRVTVVERNADVGGQVASHTVDGVRFDLGPTTFTLPAVFRDLFRKTGRPIEREVEVIPVDPAVRYVLSGGIAVDLPNASRAGTIQALDAALGGGAGEQWDNVIRQAAAIWRVARPRIIEVPFSTRDAARLTLSPAIRRTVTRPGGLRALGDKHLRDHRLQDMLDTYATSWGADPASAPAALAMLAYIQQTFGIWTVRGGLQHLVEALRQRVEDLGGVVRVQCTVDSVARERGRAAGVRLAGGETLDADVVVSAVSAEHLYRDLVSTHRVGGGRPRRPGG
jgi:phytoene desaturase